MTESLGEKLRILRKQKGWTQGEFAEKAGFHRSTYGGYETGRRTPSLQELERIAAFYGVGLDYFGVASTDEIMDILARSKKVFANDTIPAAEKAELYKEIMRLYLAIADNGGK